MSDIVYYCQQCGRVGDMTPCKFCGSGILGPCREIPVATPGPAPMSNIQAGRCMLVQGTPTCGYEGPEVCDHTEATCRRLGGQWPKIPLETGRLTEPTPESIVSETTEY